MVQIKKISINEKNRMWLQLYIEIVFAPHAKYNPHRHFLFRRPTVLKESYIFRRSNVLNHTSSIRCSYMRILRFVGINGVCVAEIYAVVFLKETGLSITRLKFSDL